MADTPTVFFDFDDTLSDFPRFGEMYTAALSRRLAAELGGEPEEWQPAVAAKLGAGVANYEERFVGHPLAGYRAWIEEERARVAGSLLERMGCTLPAGETVADYARRLQFEALTVCNATFGSARGALEALRRDGVELRMASSQESDFLRGALTGAGLLQVFEGVAAGSGQPYVATGSMQRNAAAGVPYLFGPDLVDCAKEGPEFYRRVFSVCGIRPSQAIVVDDQPQALDWAEEAGARVVQACVRPAPLPPEFPIVLRNLADLPALVRMGVV